MVTLTNGGFRTWRSAGGPLAPQDFSNANKVACAVESGAQWPMVVMGGAALDAYASDDAGVIGNSARTVNVADVTRLVPMERPLDTGHFAGLRGDAGIVVFIGATPGGVTNVLLGLQDGGTSMESHATDLIGGLLPGDTANLPSLLLATPAGIERWHFVFSGDSTRAQVVSSVVLPGAGVSRFASGLLTPDGQVDLVIGQTAPPRLVLLRSE
jgi:hypothetical protein